MVVSITLQIIELKLLFLELIKQLGVNVYVTSTNNSNKNLLLQENNKFLLLILVRGKIKAYITNGIVLHGTILSCDKPWGNWSIKRDYKTHNFL